MDSRREIPKCNCGLDADLRTSWSNANPGRRFFGCSKYGAGRNCNFVLCAILSVAWHPTWVASALVDMVVSKV
ncbi:hypothetical protein V6N13_097047 [Hibiscus sabdariffa]